MNALQVAWVRLASIFIRQSRGVKDLLSAAARPKLAGPTQRSAARTQFSHLIVIACANEHKNNDQRNVDDRNDGKNLPGDWRVRRLGLAGAFLMLKHLVVGRTCDQST